MYERERSERERSERERSEPKKELELPSDRPTLASGRDEPQPGERGEPKKR
jgi:hypothetical protein